MGSLERDAGFQVFDSIFDWDLLRMLKWATWSILGSLGTRYYYSFEIQRFFW